MPGTFHNNHDNLKTIFRNVGIFVALTLAVMGVPGASASPVVYDPVSQFYTQSSLNGYNTAVQSGANGWNYGWQDYNGGYSPNAGHNTGDSTLLTWSYNLAPYQIYTGPNALYSQWAQVDGSSTGNGSIVFDNGAGKLGMNVGSASTTGGGTGWNWTSTLLTWTAPTAGTVDVSYFANAASSVAAGGTGQTIQASLDLWNGMSVINLSAQRGLVADSSPSTFSATSVAVNAGDQIQFWRDGVSWQLGTVLLDGTLTFTAVPEPSTWALLAFGLTTVMVLHRRRSRA